jgi:hypothetical protein
MRIALVVVVVGCSSAVPPPTTAPTRSHSTSDLPERAERAESVERYCDSLLDRDDFPTIASKLPIDLRGDHVTAEMLAMSAVANDDEKREILSLVARHAQCHAKETALVGSLSGPPSLWYVHERKRHLDALVQLHAGALTYAQFNQALKNSDAVSKRERADEETKRVDLPPEQLTSFAEERARQAAEVQRAYEQFVKTGPPPAVTREPDEPDEPDEP